MNNKVIEINVGKAKRDMCNRVMRVVNLSPESIQILERYSGVYDSDGAIIDAALQLYAYRHIEAKEYQARINRLRLEEKRLDAERKARSE